MGDWYVIANIPTFIEKDAYNAIESYRLDDDGTVATTFRFNKGSLDGPHQGVPSAWIHQGQEIQRCLGYAVYLAV